MITNNVWIKPSKSEREIFDSLRNFKSIDCIFYDAVKNNCTWMINKCLDEGANIRFADDYAIVQSIYLGNIDVVKILMDWKDDVLKYYDDVIGLACFCDQIDIIKLLLTYDRVKESLDERDKEKLRNLDISYE